MFYLIYIFSIVYCELIFNNEKFDIHLDLLVFCRLVFYYGMYTIYVIHCGINVDVLCYLEWPCRHDILLRNKGFLNMVGSIVSHFMPILMLIFPSLFFCFFESGLHHLTCSNKCPMPPSLFTL